MNKGFGDISRLPTKQVTDKNGHIKTVHYNPEKDKKKQKISNVKEQIIAKLEEFAVPMMEVEYSREEYNRLFPEGTVKTPLKTVKMGTDQYAKLGRKDSGGRQSYIGAVYQTLTDPIIIIKEGDDDVYIKSFSNEKGFSTFISVEKDKEDGRFIVTNYFRHKSEVLRKIKWADSIAYLKDDRGSPARMDKEGVPHAESSHTSKISPESTKKSTGTTNQSLRLIYNRKTGQLAWGAKQCQPG
jgi:hypothetical protein